MNAFFYSLALQWKLDIRSKSLLVTCYVVPLIFFLLMGGIFPAAMPEMRETLIPSMIVMGVSMGALIGLPPTLLETYGGDIKKGYRANGIPFFLGLAAMFLSALLHLMILCAAIVLLAPVLFEAAVPAHLPRFFLSLVIYTAVSLGIGSIFGLALQSQAKLTMVSQLVFLPSILLSGILFPVEFLPDALKTIGRMFPAFWGYRLLSGHDSLGQSFWYFALTASAAAALCGLLLKKRTFQ